jgi:hypothetical protein
MNTDYQEHSLYQSVLDIKYLTNNLEIYNKLKSCKTKGKSKAQGKSNWPFVIVLLSFEK